MGRSAIPAIYAAIEGPQIVGKAGIAAIREKSIRQTSRLVELADDRGFRIHVPRDSFRRGGTVAFDVPNAREVAQTLLDRDILVDFRPGAGIRLAPHFYTRDEELEEAVAAIDDILLTGAWSKHAGRSSVVT